MCRGMDSWKKRQSDRIKTIERDRETPQGRQGVGF